MALGEVIPLRKGENPEAVRAARKWLKTADGVGFQSEILAPTLTAFLPPSEQTAKDGATGVVICPGGGYRGQATKLEGYEPALWLNSLGIAAFVLTYRLPNGDASMTRVPAPLADAQRALRLVRYNSNKWNVNHQCVGIMGFSAGGHLAAMAATRFTPPDPAAPTSSITDPVDRLSDRPDFAVLLYPVIAMHGPHIHAGSRTALLGEKSDAKTARFYSPHLHVTKASPPAFLCHAHDDPGVPVENSVQFYEAQRKANLPGKLMLYAKGGHGFGLGVGRGPVSNWPQRCAAWMKSTGCV